jgi:hypothetical protein
MGSILPCCLPFGKAGGLQILCCQGFEVNDYNFTLDALALKPSGFCNVRVFKATWLFSWQNPLKLGNGNIQSTHILSLTAMGFRGFGVQGSAPGISDVKWTSPRQAAGILKGKINFIAAPVAGFPLRYNKLRGIKPCRFHVALKVIRVIRVICEICGLKKHSWNRDKNGIPISIHMGLIISGVVVIHVFSRTVGH